MNANIDNEQQIKDLNKQITKLQRNVNALSILLVVLLFFIFFWIFRIENKTTDLTKSISDDYSSHLREFHGR